tara:strand:- start:2271 stop:2453 length:183 start_codon:yes stop_codon:yes gene_type:complete
MKEKKRFIIVINWDNCLNECLGPYNSEASAEKALKRLQLGWNSRDWYKASADISKLKPAI